MRALFILLLFPPVLSGPFKAEPSVVYTSVSNTSVRLQQSPLITMYGIRINITDMNKAIHFYGDILGYQPGESTRDSTLIALSYSGPATKLFLNKVRNLLPERLEDARPSFSMQVNNLDSTIAKLKTWNIEFAENEKRKEGVGYAIYIKDPFGKMISLMQQTIIKPEHFTEPKIYNYGFNVSNMDTAIHFYCSRLGFYPITDRYLPYDVPLGINKSFAYMLHYREMVEPIKNHSSDYQHTDRFSIS